jgi:cytochrome d ubiquinol oxidase subunit I
MLMLAIAWLGSWLVLSGGLERQRWLLWSIFASFPLGFIATLTGWFTAEVGRQPWTVYNQLRTMESVTPSLTSPQVATSLVAFALVYALIFIAGTVYIYRVLKLGPVSLPDDVPADANPKRPLAIQGDAAVVQPSINP